MSTSLRRLLWIVSPILWIPGIVFSQLYPVSDIPAELSTGAHAVIREEILIFEILGPGSAREYQKMVVTLLDDAADGYSEKTVGYDKFSKITSFEGRLYDKEGELIRKLKQSDISDHSNFSGSMFDDNRLKYASFSHPDYPHTIEFEYGKNHTGLLSVPGWYFLGYDEVSVQKSTYIIKVPKNLDIRYKEMNMPITVKVEESNGILTYSWELTNLKYFEAEPFMPNLSQVVPCVFTAVNEFNMDNVSGNQSTWDDFANWVNALNEGRDSLPPATISYVKELIKDVNGKRDQVKVLYEYMQSKTRYISIQVGIGGWQPFDAAFVDKNGYGDCKALSNYMQSILKVAAIPSYYTLIYGGTRYREFMEDLPSPQFNHAILCVPIEKDTIWLECTSQRNPFGYLGTFTGDRKALVITGKGGTIVNTTSYPKEVNLQIRKINITLMPDGIAEANISTEYTGTQYENRDGLIYSDKDTQLKWLYDNLNIPDFEISGYEYSRSGEVIPSIVENLKLKLKQFGSVSGKRIFIEPNLMNKTVATSVTRETRVFDIVSRSEWIDIDSVFFDIPEGYHLEFIPKPFEISSGFGNYSSRIETMEGKIIYIRREEANKGTFPKEMYDQFRDYVQKISATDKIKLVLVKST